MAGVSAKVEVNGLADTLRTLRRVDPELRKTTIKRMKVAAKPMQAEAKKLFPSASPLSGWGNWRGGYDGATVKRNVKVSFKGSKTRNSDTIPLLTLRQTSAAGVIFDIAGRKSQGNSPSGRAMIARLDRFAPASRVMWPTAERHMPEVVRGVRSAIDDMSRQINEELR
jgi:hypothetical protein